MQRTIGDKAFTVKHNCNGKIRPHSQGTIVRTYYCNDPHMLNADIKCDTCNRVFRRLIDKTQAYI